MKQFTLSKLISPEKKRNEKFPTAKCIYIYTLPENRSRPTLQYACGKKHIALVISLTLSPLSTIVTSAMNEIKFK